ncbi:MAG TPA: ribonuclease E inhibitor RraB [Gammaproteobacteria bacterium]
MNFPDDANGDVLRRMTRHGFDFSKPHPVEFFAVFPTEAAADAVARQYVADHESDPLENIETSAHEPGGMELMLVKNMFVTYENIKRFEAVMRQRVAAQGGRLDGWGVMQDEPEAERTSKL